MQHLFGPAGEQALAHTLQQAPLLAFDFDGTLTPIVASPDDVQLAPEMAERLAALAARLPVAIVTGRSVADVSARLGFRPTFIVGNHGAEMAGDAGDASAEAATGAATASAALAALRARVADRQAALADAGVSVEDKGHSLALHYRLSRTRGRALKVVAELLAGHDHGLRIFGGKLVINAVPQQAPDKADAVHALVRRCGAASAVFAGDDINDEPVFARAPPQWLTVRVGRDGRSSKARFYLQGPAEAAAMLDRMLSVLSAPPPARPAG